MVTGWQFDATNFLSGCSPEENLVLKMEFGCSYEAPKEISDGTHEAPSYS